MSMFRYSGNGSMRYNNKELAFIAIQPAKFFTKEGPLYMRSTQGSHFLARRKDVYNERWCRLRGNLLFYFKGRDLLSEPLGVIVLEQCFVKEEYAEIQPYAFCIEFVGEEHNQYFAAHSAELRDEWVAILQKGSYESLRSQFHALRAQLLARTGQDPIDEERHGVVGKNDSHEPSSGEPVLEMSISCTELPKNAHGLEPSTFVSISCVTPPDTRWSKSGQTEIIDQNSNPFFLTTIAFETSRNISPITRLRANIYEVQDRNIHKTSTNLSSVSAPRPSTVYNPGSTDSFRTPSATSTLYAIDEMQPTPPPRRRRTTNNNNKPFSSSHLRPHSHVFPTTNHPQSTANTQYLHPLSALSVSSQQYLHPQSVSRPSSEIITSYHPLSVSCDAVVPQIMPIGSVICSFRDIVTSPENRLILDVIGTDQTKSGGQITLLLWELEQAELSRPTSVILPETTLMNMLGPPPQAAPRRNRSMSLSRDNYFRALYCSPCTKTYRYPDTDGTLVLVQEIMVESRLSFSIPQQMIKLFLREEKKKLEELSMFGELSKDWEEVRSAIMAEHVHLTVQYNESLEHLSKHHKGPQFKRSVDKGEKLLEFVPTNLHLQRLRVEQPSQGEKVYDVITVGAPAGHTMKFKHGGLKRILQQYSEEQSKSAIGCVSQSSIAAEKLAKLGDLKRKLDWSCTDLLTAAKHFSIETMKNKAASLAEKVTEIVSLCEAPFMEEMFNQYRIAQTNGKPPSRKTTAKRTQKNGEAQRHAADGECASSSSSGFSTDNHRKSTISNPSSVHNDRGIFQRLNENMNIILQVIEVLPSNASARERYQSIDHIVKNLQDSMKYLEDQARFSIGFYRMQEEHKNMTLLQTLQYRRDVVLSQAISALIAGVVTKIRSNLNNAGFLQQACKIGILVHFESLLSTYGDEMGMVEDMSVGINDLQFVSFKFTESTTLDADLVPVISGTRSSILVTIPLPHTLYKDLPGEIRDSSGQAISVHPIMFSVGMNEEQSLAELFGDTSLQDIINRESLQKLEIYYEKFIRNVPSDERTQTDSALPLEALMSSIKHHVASKKNKNMEVLHVSSQLVRRMNGVRLTSCKSAKDRTAMSVTLEQCLILQDEHHMPAQMFAHLLDTMRSEGTRRDNTRKNVGVNKYAFNKYQLRAFPKLYRPPEGTYGKAVVT